MLKTTKMQNKTFSTGLAITTTLVLLLGYSFIMMTDLDHHAPLFYISVAIILPLSLVVYYLASRLAGSKDKYALIRLVLGNMMGKLFLAVLLIVAYTQTRDIDTTLFVVPFFITYIGFTIFETYFLHEISKVDH